ncbi:MAG: flagellar biosynthesis protein FlhA [Betaproteobacteria bacterium]|nr:flagellar biosynthesis protein FlhA [Betaproteobacteria bacterium]
MSAFDLSRLGLTSASVRTLAVPMLIIMMLVMMLLPLPPLMLDLLFTFNIALALLVMMVSVYTLKPLDFAAFPVVLLVTTLLRLSLNVASTRQVLMNGHTGAGAAGKVIESFGHFVIGGNFAVGLIVFAILVVINFVVVTKGAGRIAEVSARFTLDAMPGKQMAIDADLNAGLIDEKTAKARRQEVAHEADFFGAMDGASKFVRGDAVAGIMILVITILGGLAIGMFQHNLSFSQAASNYVLLAVGDGLVAQVPALLISIAAALVVSRVGSGKDMGSQMVGDLTAVPRALGIASAVLVTLGLVPGMPHLVFLSLGFACGYGAYWLGEQSRRRVALEAEVQVAPVEAAPVDASWDDLQPVDVVGLEVGYRLIPMVDRSQDGELLRRIKAIRKKFAQDVGFLPTPVHIRDNLELKPSGYRITVKGVTVGEGEAIAGLWLAINPGGASGSLPGTPTRDPAFGLPAVWIDASTRDAASAAGFTVVDAATVVATHMSTIIQQQAGQLLGRQEVQGLLEHLGRVAPKLLEDLVPKVLPMPVFQRVLQNLLDEGVHIRDMRTIAETLAEFAPRTQDAGELTAQVRAALGHAIVQSIYGGTREVPVIALEPQLERVVAQALGGEGGGLEPSLADMIADGAARAAEKLDSQGLPAVLLVPDRVRAIVARLVRRAAPRLRVLGHSEIPETSAVRIATVIGGTP